MLQTVTLFGITINPYDLFNNLGYICCVVFVFFTLREFEEACVLPSLAYTSLERKRGKPVPKLGRKGIAFLLFMLFFIPTFIAVNLAEAPISQLFLGNTDANFTPSILVGPFVVFLLALLLKSSPMKTLDISVIVIAAPLFFFKIACFCWGCCNGVACDHGMMNVKTGRMEFPVQLVEAACAVVMQVILMVLFKKGKQKKGVLYPLFMLMYSGSRFISEFWRDDYQPVWGRLNGYHLQLLLGFVLGAVALIVVLIWGERITAYFEAKNKAFLEKHQKKIKAKKKIVHSNKRRKK